MRSRLLYWFLGALSMLVLIVIAAVVAFWVISEPVDDAAPPVPRPRPTVTQPGEATPPAILGKDEVWLGEIELSSALLLVPEATLRDVEASVHLWIERGPILGGRGRK